MKKALSAFAIAAAAAALVFSTGCESAEGNAVEISASVRDLTAKGQVSVLKASGWNGYKWSLSDKSIGRLDRDTGGSVVYTALKMPAEGGAYLNQVVTCQTTDSGDGGGAFSTITLRHVSKGGHASGSSSTNSASHGGGDVPMPGAKLAVTPVAETATVREGRVASVVVRVVDPEPGAVYHWTRSPELGSLSRTSGESTVYNPPKGVAYAGRVVTVTCRDSSTGETATSTITLTDED